MTILSSRDRKLFMAVVCLVATSLGNEATAFINRPAVAARTTTTTADVKNGGTILFPAVEMQSTSSSSSLTLNSLWNRHAASHHSVARRRTGSILHMAASDFDQMQYTEAAWAIVAALTQAADYYQAGSIEAPLILELLLNPRKHNAGEDAESAERAVKRVLGDAGVDPKELRQGLESYLSGRPKMSGGGQKSLGRDTSKVLESARAIMSVLGVRTALLFFVKLYYIIIFTRVLFTPSLTFQIISLFILILKTRIHLFPLKPCF